MKPKPTTTYMLKPPNLDDLSPVERRRKVTVKWAADFNTISVDTFIRNYGHLIKGVGKRRKAVDLEDAILLPPPP